jgi:DNA-binding response OmpR family regulator
VESKLKILLVSDRVPERDALALAVGQRGFHPRVASTFELSFAAAQEQPDVLVVDVESPRADELAGTVRESGLDCPVVILSDRSPVDLRALADKFGAAGYLDRASSPAALVSIVERVLRASGDTGEVPQESVREPPRESQRERIDFVGLARRSTRDQFVLAWPCPFLVSESSLISQAEKKNTADILDSEVIRAIQEAVSEKLGASPTPRRYVDTPKRSSATALAIRRATDAASDTITVGRALDVDVFIDHATISKHHASFVRAGESLRVADTGSRNGTWVSGRLLEPNGAHSPIVESGDTVRFGELEFTFLSSTAAWDVLRVNVR